MEIYMDVEEIKILKHIEEILHIVSKILEIKKIYENLDKEYSVCEFACRSIDSQLRMCYPKEYYDYARHSYSRSYWTNHDMSHGLKSLILEKNRAHDALRTLGYNRSVAKNEYENNNLFESYLVRLEPNNLNDIIQHLDIDTKSETNDILIPMLLIKNSIMKDFEILDEFEIEITDSRTYRGTITIFWSILNEKSLCEQLINKCDEYINKYNDLYIRYKDALKIELEKSDHYFDKEYTLFDRIFRPKRVEKLFDEIDEDRRNLSKEMESIKKDIEKLSAENKKLCAIYLKHCEKINELIDRLGEASLRELIINLNIVIPKTDANYFNEKEEMRKAIKNWFINENAKITMQLEKQTIDNEENQKKLML
jgi:hypothetical protein